MAIELRNRRKLHNRRFNHKLQTPVQELVRKYKQAVSCTGLTEDAFKREIKRILGTKSARQPITKLF